MRKEILDDIVVGLSGLGIEAQAGTDTDLVINKEFLDAKWSTGDKKISYESSIFVNEDDKTIYMYEKTTEIGKGLSFGMSGESFSQSGNTLMRKVKSVQYGPEGKAYEIEIDLGAIPKSVKEIAGKYGYKFKTVIMKKKALYPTGNRAQENSKPKDKVADGKIKVNTRILNLPLSVLIGLAITIVLVALIYLILEVTIVGWIFALVSFGLLFFYFYKHPLIKMALSILLLVVTFIVLFIVGAANSNSDNGSKAAGDDTKTGEKTESVSKLDNSKNVVGITLAKPANWDLMGQNGKVLMTYRKSDLSTVTVLGISGMDEKIYNLKKITAKDIVGTTVAKISSFEKIKIGEWDAVKILADDTTGTSGGYVYIYYINFPGYSDGTLMVNGRTLDEVNSRANEWEGFLPGIQLIYQ